MGRFIIALCLILSSFSATLPAFVPLEKEQQAFREQFFNNVRKCVQDQTSSESEDAVYNLIKTLEDDSFVSEVGDKSIINKYILVASCIQKILSEKLKAEDIYGLIGVTHLPIPIVNENFQEYFNDGGVLYEVYPKGGFESLPTEQQVLYLSQLQQYPNNLYDWSVNCEQLASDMQGFTYFFRTVDGCLYAFAFSAQGDENRPDHLRVTAWFGPFRRPIIMDRVVQLFDYFNTVDGPSPARFGLGRFTEWPPIETHQE